MAGGPPDPAWDRTFAGLAAHTEVQMFPEQDTHPPVGPQKFVTHLTLFVQPPTCVAHFFEPGRGLNTWPPATPPASLWVSSCTVSRCSSSFASFGAFLPASFVLRRVI